MDIMYLAVSFLLLFSNVLKVDTSNNEPLSLSNEDWYLFDYPPECLSALDTFAAIASNFTMCSIQYAKPMRLCENCINEYLSFLGEYEKLVTKVVNGTSCKLIFISNDRLDAVLEYHDNILNIWNKGHCNACYNWNNSIPVLSKEIERFNEVYNETKNCIKYYINPAHNNSEEVCGKCMQAYLDLDNHYKSLSADSLGLDSVCMDVVDSMNLTRSIWSKTLNCCKVRKSPEIIFLCCTTIISVLPLLYYLVLRYFGQIRDLPHVLRQSRFKQRILRTVNRRIN